MTWWIHIITERTSRMLVSRVKQIRCDRRKLFIWYSILFLICAAGVFFAFFRYDQSLIWKFDGLNQHFAGLVKLRRLLKEVIVNHSFSFWSWDIGLGADTVGNMAWVMGDPFSYITVLFKPAYMHIGYNLSILLRLYCAGFTFLCFLRNQRFEVSTSLIGGIGYAFSSWLLGALVHPFFLTQSIVFPMLILGIEKIYQRKSPFLLIAASFFSCTSSLYFTYMNAIMCGIYSFVRYFEYNKFRWASCLKKMCSILGYALVGGMISAPMTFSAVYTLLHAGKGTGIDFGFFHSLKQYIMFLPNFLSTDTIFNNYSYIGMYAIFVILIPAILVLFRKKKTSAIMCLLSVLTMLFPFLSSIMNGFSYPAGRWGYAFIFFFIWAGLQAFKEVKFSVRQMKIWVAFIAIWSAGICTFLLNIMSVQTLVIIFVNIFFACVSINIIKSDQINIKLFKRNVVLSREYMLIICLVFNIIFVNNVKNSIYLFGNTGIINEFLANGAANEKYEKSTQRVANKIKDGDFWRTYQLDYASEAKSTHASSNDNMYYGTKSIYTYLSTTNSLWSEFNKAVGNHCGYFYRVCSYGNDNRTRLDFLTGVKYFLGNDYKKNLMADQYAGYGYKVCKKIDKVNILKNNYNIGLGCIYNRYMPEKEFYKLSTIQREEALMQAAIVDDKYASELPPDKILKATDLKTDTTELGYKLRKGKGVVLENNKFTVKSERGTLYLDVDSIKDAEIYICFKNLKRTPPTTAQLEKFNSNQIDSPLQKAQFDKANDTTNLYGSYQIYYSKDNRIKLARNNIGSNSGFKDIKNITCNMGYYKDYQGEIKLTFPDMGDYTFDSLKVYAVPANTYTKQAEKLQKSKFNVDINNNDYIEGTVKTEQEGVLYLSMLKTEGWQAYIDGKKVDNIQKVNVAFQGFKIPKGEHKIVLKYRPVGFNLSIGLFISGCFITVILLCFRKRNSYRKNNTVVTKNKI